MSFSDSRILYLYNPSKMSSDGIFVIDNRIPSHFESNSRISSFRRPIVNRSAQFSRRIVDSSDPKVLVDQVSNLSSSEKAVFSVSFHFLRLTFLLNWALWIILFSAEAIFASSTSKFGIRVPSYRRRRFWIIHWINHLYFFDPHHNFRRKLWASTYLSLEYYLPTSERCWREEFVKMRIWNLQSLLVCPTILWKSSLTWEDWISGWRFWLASLILSWCLAFTHHMRWRVFWYIRDPWIWLLRIRSWRRRRWICKNVSRYTMRVPNTWRPIVAARHSQRTA